MNRLSSNAHLLEQPSYAPSTSSEEILFKTNSDGCIAIQSDWVSVFERMRRLGSYYLQTRHAYARLVTKTDPLAIHWDVQGKVASDPQKRLFLNPNERHDIFARISRCSCCESPGRIEFRNRYGMEVMQICCPPDIKAIDWAKAIAECTQDSHSIEGLSEGHPIIPGDAQPIPLRPCSLAYLFDGAHKNKTSLAVTLVTTGIVHRETIKPNYIYDAEQLLTVYGGSTTLQFGNGATRGFFFLKNSDTPRLLIGGPDNAQLLAISPTQDPASLEFFNSFLGPFLGKQNC